MLKKIFLFISVFLVFLIPVNAETSSIPTRDMDEYISMIDIPVTPDKSPVDLSYNYGAKVPMSQMKYSVVTTTPIFKYSPMWGDSYYSFDFIIIWSSEPFIWDSSIHQFSLNGSTSMYCLGRYYVSGNDEYNANEYYLSTGFTSDYNNFTTTSLSYSSHKIYDKYNNLVFRPAPTPIISKETATGLVETILANRNLILGSTLCLVAFLLLLKVLYKGLWTFSQTP